VKPAVSSPLADGCAGPGWSSRPLPSGCTHAADPQRLEHPLERDARLQAGRPHVVLGAVEEAEDGLVGRDEDRAKELQLMAVPSELTGRRGCARSGLGELLFGHAWPVALDQVQVPLAAAGHGGHVTGASAEMNQVLPYIYAGTTLSVPAERLAQRGRWAR